MENLRIPTDVLTSNFKDGDPWDAATLNKIVEVICTGVNANFRDLNNTEYNGDVGLSAFILQTYDVDKKRIQEQIDGKITTYFDANDPNDWTIAERPEHDGDMWYQEDFKMLKRYDADTNLWEIIEDEKAIAAYDNAAHAQDTADGKRRVFTEEPYPPYDVGDLWAEGPTGDIKKCFVQRLTGDFDIADWEFASKYTDDSLTIEYYAEQVIRNDEILSRVTRTEIRIDPLETDMEVLKSDYTSISQRADEIFSRVARTEIRIDPLETDMEVLKSNYTSISQRADEIVLTISEIDNGTLENSTVTIDRDGILVGKNNSEFSSQQSNTGLTLYAFKEQAAEKTVGYFNKDGMYASNAIIDTMDAGALRFVKVGSGATKRQQIHFLKD